MGDQKEASKDRVFFHRVRREVCPVFGPLIRLVEGEGVGLSISGLRRLNLRIY